MSEPKTIWSFDRDDLFESLGLDGKEQRQLKNKSDEFIRAILEVAPPDSSEQSSAANGMASASAPLYITGTKYHINLTQAGKTILQGTLGIIAKACILQSLGLAEFAVVFSSTAIVELWKQLTKLTDRQRHIIETVLELKRASELPDYWPSTREVAKKLALKAGEIENELKPIIGKVVTYHSESRTWQVIF